MAHRKPLIKSIEIIGYLILLALLVFVIVRLKQNGLEITLQTLFPCLFIFAFLSVAWSFTFRGINRLIRGSIFPPISTQKVLHKEYFASGNSQKNWKTKHGGAANCLKLVVTDTELWVCSFFPFSLMCDEMDLEHRIPKDAISQIKEQNKSGRSIFTVTFTQKNAEPRILVLMPKQTDNFRESLKVNSTEKWEIQN